MSRVVKPGVELSLRLLAMQISRKQIMLHRNLNDGQAKAQNERKLSPLFRGLRSAGCMLIAGAARKASMPRWLAARHFSRLLDERRATCNRSIESCL